MGMCIRTTPALIPKPFELSAFCTADDDEGCIAEPSMGEEYDLGLCFWTPKEEGAKQRWLS